jgi:predicted RNase H-like HicB family nuclease
LEFFFFYHSSGVSRMIWSVFIRLMPGRIVTRRALRVAEDEWKMRQYIALIHKEANSDYGISFPDLPGVISAGKTLDEARDMGAEAVALHLEGIVADGEAAPEPSSLEKIMKDAQSGQSK